MSRLVPHGLALSVLLAGASLAAGGQPTDARAMVAERVTRLTRASTWRPIAQIPLAFTTHHPQGLVKVGDTWFVSSVEVRRPTRPTPDRPDGHDRDTGEGVGHLFKVSAAGQLITDLTLGEGSIYHPGGIDFDGVSIWVSVAEYRPNSRSIVYRVDPATMKATEVFRIGDHLGGIVHDTEAGTLNAVSWGSRWFYQWSLDAKGTVVDATGALDSHRTANPSHYVDYQDCKYVGGRRMLCSGLAVIAVPHARAFELGGLDLIDLASGRPIHQVPVALWTAGGESMTHNPVFLEPAASGLRAYFLPEDDRSTLYIYTVDLHD